MKQCLKIYQNLSLKRKMLVILSAALLLVSITAAAAVTYLMNASNRLLYRSTASALSYSSNEIASLLETVDTTSDLIISNNVIQETLRLLADAGNDDYSTDINTLRIYNELHPYLFNNRYISFISIYTQQNEKRITTSGYHPVVLKEPLLQEMLEEAQAKRGKICWNTTDAKDSGVYLIRSIREIKNFTLETLGHLVIRLDMERILNASTSFSSDFEDAIFLVFDQNQLIYSSEDNADFQSLSIPEKGYKIIDFDHAKYFAVSGNIKGVNWNYVCLVPYDSTFRTITTAYLVCILILAISTLAAIFLSETLIQNILKHLDSLIKKMSNFQGENTEVLDIGYDYSIRKDELGVIHCRFDDMAAKIHSLINDNYVKQLLIKDAQLKALETQINPHFLYNTLESVNWRAKAIGEKQISEMVEALGRLLRATLSKGSEILPLIKELEFTKSYLTIQQIRYEDRLEFIMDIPESLYQIPVPKLSIQPLVENAIHYSLEQNTGTCTILLQTQCSDNQLRIIVKNDGSQFEEDLLEKLRAKSIEPHGMGIGLTNIDSRIKLNFGPEYGLLLYNEGEMAAAAIILPYTKMIKEGSNAETNHR